MTRDNAIPDEVLRVYQVIATIPAGRVMSYGGVAEAAGLKGRARWVGRLMSQLPKGTKLPWHRVVSASGDLIAPVAEKQRTLLEEEGLTVGKRVARPAYL